MPTVLSEARADMSSSLSVNGNGHHTRTDTELIEQCLKKDEQAWAALLDRYSGLIYSIVLKCHLPPEEVAEVFQSICLTLLQRLENLQDEVNLSSWLTTTTLLRCRSLVELDHVEAELTDLPAGSPLLEEEIEQMEQERLVRQALSMMEPPSQRLLTSLLYEEDLWSYEEIAQELGLPVSTIEPERGRCLQQLLNRLNELGFFSPEDEFLERLPDTYNKGRYVS